MDDGTAAWGKPSETPTGWGEPEDTGKSSGWGNPPPNPVKSGEEMLIFHRATLYRPLVNPDTIPCICGKVTLLTACYYSAGSKSMQEGWGEGESSVAASRHSSWEEEEEGGGVWSSTGSQGSSSSYNSGGWGQGHGGKKPGNNKVGQLGLR